MEIWANIVADAAATMAARSAKSGASGAHAKPKVNLCSIIKIYVLQNVKAQIIPESLSKISNIRANKYFGWSSMAYKQRK